VDPWAVARQACVEVLERRRRERALPPKPLRGLSTDALGVLSHLHGEGGRTFFDRLMAIVPDSFDFLAGFRELVDLGLLEAAMAVDEDGEPAEVIVTLRYDVELPPSAE
jgi:hypothetical protein